MADIEFNDDVVGAAPLNGVALAGIVNWLGALVSVALIAGLAYWGYQLMVRDVSGIPVVRALQGPMREAPLDPGGTATDYQGLAVNNIAAVGEAEAPADRLVLAPKPTVLTPEDQTAGSLDALAQSNETTDATPDELTPRNLALGSDAEVGEVPALDQASLIEATLRAVDSGNDLAVEPASGGALQAPIEVISTSIPGVTRSRRPGLRPAQPQGEQLASASEPVATATGAVSETVATVNPADIAVGTRLAQLGAFETEAIAVAQWQAISARFADFMDGKSRVIQKAQSGGKVFYRLRAHGFSDLSDARRFCSALLAKQANCIPVVTR